VQDFSADTATIEFAASLIEAEPWTPTPLLQAQTIGRRLDAEVWLKREDCTPIGSFKLRGAITTAGALASEVPEAGVYVASAGNYGLAIVYACARYGIPVTVVAPEGATPSKLDRIRLLGGTVEIHGRDFDVAKGHAKEKAGESGGVFWEDGVIEEMATGAGTIATELLRDQEPWDMVVVPLGNGSLIKGIAQEMKRRSPSTKIMAVVPEGAPAMAQALLGQQWDESAPVDTLADGLAVRVPIPKIVEELTCLVDDVWTVSESDILPAVKSLMELEQVFAEPSAATPIAAMAGQPDEVRGKRVAAIVTGAHLSMSLLPDIASTRGLL
jgi:threonine dehydratase